VTRAGLALTQRLAAEQGVSRATSYWSLGMPPPLRSGDGRRALVLAQIPGDEDAVRAVTDRLSPRYQRGDDLISVGVGGSAEVFREISERAEQDLRRAEAVTLPVTLVLLVLVFGSLTAAGLPVVVGVLAVLGALLVLRLEASLTQVSIFSLNLATGMGLGLAIDYSLFVVSRYREELGKGHSPERAVIRSMQTAGRMVAFSALTVAVSLAALLVFPLPFLRSFAFAGVGVISTAAVGAIVVLPALLAVIGPHIDKGRLFRPRPKQAEDGFWYRRARGVMRRAGLVAIAVVAFLLVLGAPFPHLVTGLADDRVLAPGAQARKVHDAIRAGFPSKEASALPVVAPTAGDAPGRFEAIDHYAAALSGLPGVARVDASTGYYLGGFRLLAANALSRRFESPTGTWLSVVPRIEPLSPQGEALVKAVRGAEAPFPVLVGGESAKLVDGKTALYRRLPLALGIIALLTFVLLFLMVGSLLVPAKALVLNLLSLSATFGALVWVFQEGHLSGLLGFTPTGTINIVTPVLLFCIAFGLSMDYEVFLISRIKEEHDLGHANDEAVALGLERTGRTVTAAAVLLAVVFVSLTTSGVAVVKTFGVGLALAVLLDAFLIRATLVPAFMCLAGQANWWAPRAVRRFYLRFGLWESEPLAIFEAAGVKLRGTGPARPRWPGRSPGR